ncbi:AraC family transcriptional regulator [Marispirochaeta sp.]|uniref:AraC family transcriptional regulator n=1 Tax=Marispirochaeta sp. TaxID=2038653 RepID=UPI0029C62376|nr:AraC family transcriptional regulator [Marispirochaeta sp.]
MKYNSEDYSQTLKTEDYPCLYQPKHDKTYFGAALEEIISSSYLEVSSALAWTTRPGWRIPPRQRNETHLWVILEGKGKMSIQGVVPEVSLKPGSLVLVPENRLHSLTPVQGITFRVLVIHFLYRYLNALDVFSLLEMGGELLPVSEGSSESAMELCEAYARRRPGWRHYTAAGLMTLLYPALLTAAARFGRRENPFSTALFRRLIPAFTFIQQNLTDPDLTIADIAKSAGISQVYLRRLFRSFSGKTPQQFIQEKRLHTARNLLLHTDMAISKIAENSGFETPSYFYRLFRREYGTSPGIYRRTPQV